MCFEVKLPGKEKTLTDNQKANLKMVVEAGGYASMVTSAKQALGVLEVIDERVKTAKNRTS